MSGLLVVAVTVSLVCSGSGTRRNLHNNQHYEEAVRVEIEEHGGRIQLPPAMLPPEMRGGEDGWYRLRNFERTDSYYRAKARINFINSPTVYIDRIAGTIRIDGGQSTFSGTCERIEADAPPRF